MTALHVQTSRGGVVESVHRVSLAACDAGGALLASAGDPDRVTFMRSAAKPFQALPLVEDGVTEHFTVTPEELALACASHSSEPRHVALARGWLERLGLAEDALACGPHRPLSRDLAVRAPDDGIEQPPRPLTPVTSNCSGKHTGMLALALHHGWPTAGYQREGHPVQTRVERALLLHVRLAASAIGRGVDGCGVVSFALPLRAMARGFASLVTASDQSARTVVQAMTAHPYLVAGTGRLCTAVMEAYAGRVLAKVGADGVYGAALLDRGVGIALKVEDGNSWAAAVALVAILERLGLDPPPSDVLPQFAARPVINTIGEKVGEMRAVGEFE